MFRYSQIGFVQFLFRQIFVPVLFIGFILMNMFPFEPLVYCEPRNNINQYLSGVFEVHLLNSMQPPLTENGSGRFSGNQALQSIPSGRGVLRIFLDRNSRIEGIFYSQVKITLKSSR